MARLHSFFRSVVLTCALVAVCLLAGWIVLKYRIHDEIHREVQQTFASHYSQHLVSVRRARFIEGRGIEIHGISIRDGVDRRPIAYVDEIFASCTASMEDLLSGARPQTRQLRVRGLKIWAEQSADGSWNITDLWPLPKFGPKPPPATIQDAVVHITMNDGTGAQSFSLRNVNLSAAPDARNTPASSGDGQVPFLIQGSLQGDHFERADIVARIDPLAGGWSLRGTALNVALSPQLHGLLPESCKQKLPAPGFLSGQVNLNFQISDNMTDTEPAAFVIAGQLTQGQIIESRLPFRLYDCEADFYLDNRQLKVNTLTARNGNSTLRLTAQRDGFANNSPMVLQASVQQLTLDHRILEALPSHLQPHWYEYSPSGIVDAEIHLRFDGQHWTPRLTVTCHDVSFAYHKFPYRVHKSHGIVSYTDDVLRVDLKTMMADQLATVKGQFTDLQTQPTGWLEAICDQPIPLNAAVINALVDPKARQIVQSLHPGGMFSFRSRFERNDAADPTFHKDVRIHLHNCTMQYDKFPYPLSMIQGTVVWNDQGWTFDKLSGRNDGGYIECSGSWRPVPDAGTLLALDFVAVDIALGHDLRESLNPAARQMWAELRPQGALDHLEVHLQYASARKDLSLDVHARKWKRGSNVDGRSITIHPASFPYRLNDVAGAVHYRNGQVQLEKVSASHKGTRFALDGQCQFDRDGSWSIQLSKFIADPLEFDHDLLAALPPSLGAALGRLNLDGTLSSSGSVEFSHDARAIGKPNATWDVTLDLENARVSCGFPLEHIHGDIHLVGAGQEGSYHSQGFVNIDSLTYRDIQFTQLQGSLMIDPQQIIFGSQAERHRTDGPPRAMTAQVIGGEVSVDAIVLLAGDIPFSVQAQLNGGDLGLLAQEMAVSNQEIRGRANLLVNLNGNSQGRHSWQGDGHLRLYEADIYEIPVMLAMLKLLSVRRPDTTAFTSSEAEFRIEGETIYLPHIKFVGDAVSLKGAGELNLDRQINLSFYTLVGRRELNLAAVRTLLQQASRQLFMIHVTGTLDHPKLQSEALPMLRESLDQLSPDMSALPALHNAPTTARSRRGPRLTSPR